MTEPNVPAPSADQQALVTMFTQALQTINEQQQQQFQAFLQSLANNNNGQPTQTSSSTPVTNLHVSTQPYDFNTKAILKAWKPAQGSNQDSNTSDDVANLANYYALDPTASPKDRISALISDAFDLAPEESSLSAALEGAFHEATLG